MMEWDEMPWSRDYHSQPNAGRDPITPIDELMCQVGWDQAQTNAKYPGNVGDLLDEVVGPIQQMYHPVVVSDLAAAFGYGYHSGLRHNY